MITHEWIKGSGVIKRVDYNGGGVEITEIGNGRFKILGMRPDAKKREKYTYYTLIRTLEQVRSIMRVQGAPEELIP